MAFKGRPNHPRAEAAGGSRPQRKASWRRGGSSTASLSRSAATGPRSSHRLKAGKHALAIDETPHDPSMMFGRPYSDVYLVDTRTGERKVVAERLRFALGESQPGRAATSPISLMITTWVYDVQTGKGDSLDERRPNLVR